MSGFDTAYDSLCIMRGTETERFWAKVDKSGDCWEWTAYKLQGYGRFGVGGSPKYGGRIVYAHRWSWESVNGQIPEGMTVDHLCKNKGCVNPDHLEVVTAAENTRRWAMTVTHCPHGHEYTAENTLIHTGGNYDSRICRTCNRERLLAKARLNGVKPRPPKFAKTECVNGHPFDETNTYISPKGARSCRQCTRDAQRRFQERKKVGI